MKTLVVMASLFAWWLVYYDGERWIFRKAFGTQVLCETAAENLSSAGITARCVEIRPF